MKNLGIFVIGWIGLIHISLGANQTNNIRGKFSFPELELPQEVINTFKKHSKWRSLGVYYFPSIQAVIPQTNQKWLLKTEADGSFELQEITRLTLLNDCKTKKKTFVQARMPLIKLPLENFFLSGLDESNCENTNHSPTNNIKYNVSIRSKDRITIIPEGVDSLAIIFAPDDSQPKFFPAAMPILSNVAATPAGLFREYLVAKAGVDPGMGIYLHQDFSEEIPVIPDKNFPNEFLPSLQNVVEMWNQSYGRRLYVLTPKKSIDLMDCISDRQLCIEWEGGSTVSFTGIGGLATIDFDPETGVIIGGHISLSNSSQQGNFLTAPQSVVNILLSREFDTFDVAKYFMMMTLAKKWPHPNPEWLVERTISHEFGHINGWHHNFFGSNDGTALSPSKSLMDYVPFFAVNKDSYFLQEYDREMMNLVYLSEMPKSDYRYCGDIQAAVEGYDESAFKDPNCNWHDLGSPEEWFINLSKSAPEGVMSLHPHPNLGKPLIHYLGLFLKKLPNSTVTPAQKERVRSYICNLSPNKAEAIEYLRNKLNVILMCTE